ncbi:MAG: hypothetical protein U5K84_03885 [Alkalibacterium sp.]|nr:hypothetical protein [Alkalibacterium sp.]
MFKKGLLLGSTALLLSACGAAEDTDETVDETEEVTEETTEEDVVIRVASHLPPMTDVVELAGEVIEDGYEVELVEVSDNIQYNEALLNEEVER